MAEYLELDPASAERRQIYRMLVGSVVPRPIGWASTVERERPHQPGAVQLLHRGLRRAADDFADHRAQS